MSRATFIVEIAGGEAETALKRATDFLTTMNYEETKPETQDTHLFRRGVGALTSPKLIELSVVTEDGKTYLKCDGFITFNLFFTVGKIGELAFTSGFGYAAVPRKTGYKDFEQLRAHLSGSDISVDPGKPANRVMIALTVIIPLIIILICCACNIAVNFGEYFQ